MSTFARSKISTCFVISFLLGFSFQQGLAQSQNDIIKQLWLDVNPNWFIDPNLELFGDVAVRKEFEENGSSRSVVRPGLRYHITNGIFITGGIGSFYTWNTLIADRWEIRPFQGLQTHWPRSKIPFQHYLRLEQQFDLNTETWESLNSLRLRYRIRPQLQFDTRQSGSFWRLMASFEGFITLAGEQGQSREQARAMLALERSFRFGQRLRFEAIWQKAGLLFISNKTVDDLFIRFRYYTTIGRTKIEY